MKIWAYRSLLPLAGVLTTVIAVGCEGASAVDVATGPTAAAAAKCQPALGASSNVGAAGGSGAVSITTQPECGWTASTQASWITDLSPSSGQGSGQLAFRAAPNTDPAAREADIIVNDNRVRVVQEAAPMPPPTPQCVFQVRPGNLNIGAAGGTTQAAVSAMDRCEWGASSGVTWISVASGAKGSGSGSSTFRVAQNTGPTRSGDITVAGQTFKVTQSGAAAGPSGGDDDNDNGGDDNSGKDEEKDKDKGKDKDKDKGGKGKGDTL